MEPLKSADPTELGGIALRGRLGRGGMGIVYFGITPDGEQVAVKMIRDDLIGQPEVLSRFDREVIAIGMVQGPRVANFIAASEPEDSTPWFATEYVRGLTLAEYVQERGPLPTDMTSSLGIGLAEALTSIHEAGILHRDLKPSNILLGRDGPKVIDFGLAALLEAPGDITRSFQTVGSPVCMAPEQVNSAKGLTTAADVHSLGAVLLFAMTAHYPYERPTVAAMLAAIANWDTPPDLSGVPEALIKPITGMLAYAPAARPSLPDVTAELAKALADAGSAGPSDALRLLADHTYIERASDPPPADPPRSRHPRMPESLHVPSTLVQQVADNLRRDYNRDAQF